MHIHVDTRGHVDVVLGGGVQQLRDVVLESRASSVDDGEQRSLVRDSAHNDPG